LADEAEAGQHGQSKTAALLNGQWPIDLVFIRIWRNVQKLRRAQA
jgi:hypothetical protein